MLNGKVDVSMLVGKFHITAVASGSNSKTSAALTVEPCVATDKETSCLVLLPRWVVIFDPFSNFSKLSPTLRNLEVNTEYAISLPKGTLYNACSGPSTQEIRQHVTGNTMLF